MSSMFLRINDLKEEPLIAWGACIGSSCHVSFEAIPLQYASPMSICCVLEFGITDLKVWTSLDLRLPYVMIISFAYMSENDWLYKRRGVVVEDSLKYSVESIKRLDAHPQPIKCNTIHWNDHILIKITIHFQYLNWT